MREYDYLGLRVVCGGAMRVSWRGIRCRHEECAEFGICLVGPPTPDLDADSAAHREALRLAPDFEKWTEELNQ